MMREHWPVLFAGSAEEGDAKAVAARVVELSSFLADRQHAPVEQARRADPDLGRVSFHDSCHGLRELGVKAQPRQLLSAAGVEVVETDGAERCCGFGGTFSVKLPAISVAMADDKLDEWVAAGVDIVVGGDLSCLVHLEGRARRRALPLRFRHVADVLIERDRQ
jgi:L-lactate dehydrogenase complex protein LldE